MKVKLLSLHAILALIGIAIAVWLFLDAGTWISGKQRYTVFFERLFDTPASASSRMRWVQGIAALALAGLSISTSVLFDRRSARRRQSGMTEKEGTS